MDAAEPTPELVQLLAEDGTVIGTHPKATVHTTDTRLHRAFSVHLRAADGRLLLTRTSRFCGWTSHRTTPSSS